MRENGTRAERLLAEWSIFERAGERLNTEILPFGFAQGLNDVLHHDWWV
jgi:hypothetical protein